LFSQIELRVIAALSGEENMIGGYSKIKEILITALKVFTVPLEEVTSASE
jgi:DNA polymerase-1